jgi:3-hydroxyisobutyrate dehydrogenase-like beta-hydroxyacid dehydrogenase
MTNNAPLGILHPGEMGASIAAAAQKAGHEVYWVAEGRSAATRARAERLGLIDVRRVEALSRRCEVIVSVCPPQAAEAVARSVLAGGFHGLYLDLNAIAPQRAVAIAQAMATAGTEFVDGGLIGGPAWQPGTWLYLSGPAASQAAVCFAGSVLQTEVLGAEAGQASALKMCYAAYSKGTTALLCAALAAAQGLGVRAALEQQWSRDGGGFAAQAESRVRRVTAKAWRFAFEMDEIAATMEGAGLPGGFHQAAGDLYRRLSAYKDAPDLPPLDEVLAALLKSPAAKAE